MMDGFRADLKETPASCDAGVSVAIGTTGVVYDTLVFAAVALRPPAGTFPGEVRCLLRFD